MAEEIKEEIKEEKKTKKPPKKAEPAMVKVKIPRGKHDLEDEHVSVNFKDYIIKKGVWVEVPVEVAEVLEHSDEMLELAAEYEEQMRSAD